MVNEWALNLTKEYSNFYGLTNTGGLYLVSLLFCVFLAVFVTVRTGNVKLGLGSFLMSLFTFAFMGMFPLWIVAVTLVVIVAVLLKLGEHNE